MSESSAFDPAVPDEPVAPPVPPPESAPESTPPRQLCEPAVGEALAQEAERFDANAPAGQE